MVSVGPNRYQVWWHSRVLGTRCDAYPRPELAISRLEELEQREHFIRGVVIDMQEHLTGQDEYQTQREFEREHKRFTEEAFNV